MDKLGPFDLGPDGLSRGIYVGNSMTMADDIPDQSVDLVFTDPLYDRYDQYYWLAKTANRILKEDKALLTFYGIGYTEETYRALRLGGREVTWNCPVYQPGQTQRIHPKVFNHWYGLLWVGGEPIRTFVDVQKSYMGTLSGSHEWRKNPAPLRKYLEAFCDPGDIVVDFFTGQGTIPVICKQYGCEYLAFEIDEEIAKVARKRVAEAQPPLFTMKPDAKQGEIDLKGI